jgi:hypothetical protein
MTKLSDSNEYKIISSTLKTVASESLAIEDEIANAKDKPLEEVLNEQKKQEVTEQGERS